MDNSKLQDEWWMIKGDGFYKNGTKASSNLQRTAFDMIMFVYDVEPK